MSDAERIARAWHDAYARTRNCAYLLPWDEQDPTVNQNVTDAMAALLAAGTITAGSAADDGPTVRATTYTVSVLPEDDIEADSWAITVEHRRPVEGRDQWAVTSRGACYLGTDGVWSWGWEWGDGTREPETEQEWAEYYAVRDAWVTAHRFDDLDTALRLAREAAPHITVNGLTAAGLLAWRAKRAKDDPDE